ncbi:MAG: serine/threonine protein kinase [Acidobacteriota bacterium]|nr:serine/threonine protein kinase [Acidobacteriota bacterium]
MKLEILVGQTLDNKYRIERELGRGGMGTVYFATHIGTERPVAVKVIAPQFMESLEFVERFRREARAAGRLRHPNVVNVTDFGLADTKLGRVAYLVMEYLDGCTLGEILEEEKHLPLSWSIDILEQVSSAINEAHKQGIIHRDLKPDNIWLEPNQRGGYTVKVLDFGIAKLEETVSSVAEMPRADNLTTNNTLSSRSKETIAGGAQPETFAERTNSTAVSEAATMAMTGDGKTSVSEAGTLIQTNAIDLEGGTAILPAAEKQTVSQQENVGTKLMSAPFDTEKTGEKETNKSVMRSSQTSDLTHVGAVLGTPLYMSPEQCRGERLTPRSDIYSLAVIAYQMLSGKTPFAGDFVPVMNAHKELAPPALNAKKVPRKVKKIIHSSLAKNADERPQSAEAFASELRAQSEGIGALLHRSLEIYSKHLPKFLGLTFLLFTPYIAVMILKLALDVLNASHSIGNITNVTLNLILVLPTMFVGIFCGYLISGTTTWIVMQTLAVPLRPVRLRLALDAMRRRWKKLAGTGILSTTLTFLGLFLCVLGFPVMAVLFSLVAPVVMMENLRGFAALKRSKRLVMRSPLTSIAVVLIMFIVPITLGVLVSIFVVSTMKTVTDMREKIVAARRQAESEKSPPAVEAQNKTADTAESGKTDKSNNFEINVNTNGGVKISDGEKDAENNVRDIVREGLTTLLMLPVQLLLAPLSSIIVALLYMKTRLVGGEAMRDLLEQFEEADRPRSNWQKRIRKRLEQSGKLLSKA